MLSQLRRIMFIDERIRQKRAYSAQHLAEEYETSVSTIKRDIADMKELLDADIVFKKNIGYVYNKPPKLLDNLSEKSLIISAIIKSILKNLNFVPLFANEMISDLNNFINKDYLELSDKIDFDLSEYEDVDITKFREIIESLLYKKVIQIHYSDQNNKKTIREVEPIKLVNYTGKWYLVAYCFEKKDVRLFAIARISKLIFTEKQFQNNYNLSEVEEYLKNSFGLDYSNNPQIAKIKIYEPVATANKHIKWHKHQITKYVKDNDNGYLEITLPVGRYQEIIGRVLKFGEYAEILEPEDLRNEWLARIKKMYDKFI
ncbi:MAG TPA: WYL domain-containing transcriptional regulator [Ignavibacteriales bacterium]|nr:WYL domain-containing transcriptional regulator [Ignavibacteriales bacterium]HOL82347.1 WYL domain-containing transcriptional regulator [Ignavibacteriales bacterium]HOM65201.1 WYL domain-containing transcriptional regulator [Ignavibacteriales bacterium]HPD66925.1 WYL domain-containing transcriptional regulator [Ignavibacteriales bacterium]HPP34567.1 WYL domain-containing transcriptional regulator [Ignavibacteriales bacterium]